MKGMIYKMKEYPDITEAERLIMEILWRDGECGSHMVTKEMKKQLGWTRQTVRTYLIRLKDKGLVDTRKINERVLHYFPVVSKKDYAAGKATGVLRKYYTGISGMVAGIMTTEKIDDSELRKLEELIENAPRVEKDKEDRV